MESQTISNTERLLRQFATSVDICRSNNTPKWAAGFDRHISEEEIKAVLVGNMLDIDYIVARKCRVRDVSIPTQRKTTLLSAVRGHYGSKGASLSTMLDKVLQDGKETLYMLLGSNPDIKVYRYQPYDAFVMSGQPPKFIKSGLLVVPPEGESLDFGYAATRNKPKDVNRMAVAGLENVYFLND